MKKRLSILREATKRFYKDRCPDKAAIISYFALLAALPMLGVLLYLGTKTIAKGDVIIQSLKLFTKDVFTDVDPSFIKKTTYLANLFSKMGLYGLIASILLSFYLFSKIIYFINEIFRAVHIEVKFWKIRLKELGLMIIGALLFLSSFVMTNMISAFNRFISKSPLGEHVNPKYINVINNFLIRYFIPFFLTFLFFFILYKMIPHRFVKLKAALISALVASIGWEAAKSIFSWYFIRIAIYGRLHGTLTAIITFVLMVDLAVSILLWGAELGYALNNKYLLRKV